jgi:CubicO group peptidase (beta-lactamase class C family)
MIARSSLVAVLPAVLLLALVPRPISAQLAEEPAVAEALSVVETWLEAQQAYDRIPAFSAALVHDQERVWDAARGLAHPDEGAEATPETLYSICSISKLFTSVALMQLRDRGLVALSDPVAEHLPWFELEQAYPGSPPVTVEGILTHSAGLPRESDHPYWSAPDFPFPARREIIDGLRNQETLYPARRYFQYSNLGLTLAGEIVRERSGTDYHDYVRENVLDPLGMDDTFSEIPEEHRGGRLATGYGALNRDGRREEVPFFQAKGIAPAAGYASTARDLARFASWQLRLAGDPEEPAPPAEVLDPHTLDEMQRVHYVDPDFDTYWGLGFNVSRRDGETFVGHGGSCPGFRSQLILQKDRKIAVAFMANAMVNAGMYARGIYDLVVEAVSEAAEDGADGAETSAGRAGAGRVPPAELPAPSGAGRSVLATGSAQEAPELAPYVGTYSAQPWGSETAVVRWKGGLALLSLPTSDPLDGLRRLEHDEGDVFYRVRDDGERGEDVVFERGPDGEVTGYRVHGNLSPRIR